MERHERLATTEHLLHVIQTTPVIDHHAHNILLPSEQETHPLLSVTTEATGEALQHTPSTLAHMRAVQQLTKILQCKPVWESVEVNLQKKRALDDDSWAKLCFDGIETVLIDDGLDTDTVHPYSWHDRLTHSPCKRIVRIEKIAEDALLQSIKYRESVRGQGKAQFNLTNFVLEKFVSEITRAILDPEVVGFKSVICYRTGLAIPQYDQELFHQGIQAMSDTKDFVNNASRLENNVLSPGFVHLTAQMISRSNFRKPFQFHTGLGDNDIRLRFSSPSHMQPFFEQYPSVPIVLLHASYPFTREAGYLASTYLNVYLDIGEVFPMVSQEGQENVIREALELCPSEKLLWSTDGHWFPETYLLAMLQIREALGKVLCEYVSNEVLTSPAAIKIVQDLLFRTANRLYDLNLTLKPLELTVSSGDLHDSNDSDSLPLAAIGTLRHFLSLNPTVKFLRLQWVDYTAAVRVRILPVTSAFDLFKKCKGVSVTKAVLGLLQNDAMSAGFRATGQYQLSPKFSSLCLGARPGYAMMQCEFRDNDGQPVAACPRTSLRKVVERARDHNMTFLVGFEIEVYFIHYELKNSTAHYGFNPTTQGQSWSSTRALHDDKVMDLVESILTQLEASGINIQQFHAESGPGQYEFVMDPLEPLAAVDSLICAREIIASVAAKHGMRATLVPKPYPNGAGSGSHVHVSMTPPGSHRHFLAGLLKNLAAIVAITLPNMASYERVADSTWSGGEIDHPSFCAHASSNTAVLGTWIAWGTQNREAPIRYISGSHYEIKCVDGFANPYLALSAILGAGVQGVQDSEPLLHKDCLDDPAKLSSDERQALGITRQMPRSIDEALGCFRDSGLRRILGDAVYENYLAVKEAEAKLLPQMEAEERRKWLIDRY